LESAPCASAGTEASVRTAARTASGARTVMGFLCYFMFPEPYAWTIN
jgi:hypothetical protein